MLKILPRCFSSHFICFLSIFCFFNHTIPALNWAMEQQVQIDVLGNALLVWQVQDDIEQISMIKMRTYDANLDIWSPIITISDPSRNAFSPRLSMNGDGEAVIVWMVTDEVEHADLYGLLCQSDGSLTSQPTQISTASDISIVSDWNARINSQGNIVVVWIGYIDGISVPVVRAVNGDFNTETWSQPVSLTD